MAKRTPLNDWLIAWIDQHYPQRTFSRPDARIQAYKALPFGHVPSVDKLIWAWFTKRFNDVLSGADFAFPDGHSGKQIVRQDMLPWDEESKILIGQLRMAGTDIDAVKARLARWAEVNDPGMDIERTMSMLKAAAGL
jgi:hypothetical protein